MRRIRRHRSGRRERASKAKHVQLVSGAPVLLFWAANAVWDYLQFLVTAAGLVALIALYRLPQFQGERLAAVAALLAVFGAAGTSLSFVMQGLFTVRAVRACCSVPSPGRALGSTVWPAARSLALCGLKRSPAGTPVWHSSARCCFLAIAIVSHEPPPACHVGGLELCLL